MKYIIFFILAVSTSYVRAQYVKDRLVSYEGSVELTSAASLNDASFSLSGVETIHGVLLERECLFIGLGAGINMVRFTPYAQKLTGDVTPEMFHYDLRKYICPAVSLHLGARFDNIRKLRKRMILFGNLKFMHLWNFRNTTSLVLNISEKEPLKIPICDTGAMCMEFCFGAEFKLRNLPNIYIGCGWLGITGGVYEGEVKWTPSVSGDAGERKTYSGGYRMDNPVPFFIRMGMRLWKKE